MLATSLSISETGRATALDDQIFEWQRVAEGYKICHVPATPPDILKTDAMVRWEYAPLTHRPTDQAIDAVAARLGWLSLTLKMAIPLHDQQRHRQGRGLFLWSKRADRNGIIRLDDRHLRPRPGLCARHDTAL